jgi:hypothetical protein
MNRKLALQTAEMSALQQIYIENKGRVIRTDALTRLLSEGTSERRQLLRAAYHLPVPALTRNSIRMV